MTDQSRFAAAPLIDALRAFRRESERVGEPARDSIGRRNPRMTATRPDWWGALSEVTAALKVTSLDALAADLALADAVRRLWDAPHIVTFTRDGYGLQHPLRCRPDLIGCEYNVELAEAYAPLESPGTYLFLGWAQDQEGMGEPVMEPLPDDHDDGFAAITAALEDKPPEPPRRQWRDDPDER